VCGAKYFNSSALSAKKIKVCVKSLRIGEEEKVLSINLKPHKFGWASVHARGAVLRLLLAAGGGGDK